ncbi:hypothetical protein P1J78_24190 [Psychromarinibacter sp. C21-152]|uniref:Uncharacterized protein n=1 Tax=Psychromarinibacter sediminicola TaxID=3033385 RepID=A0AAE3TBG1_9RHOB|nr:hypothetical protein [Psychromarinibacter sediminicola]MDF0603818.1 hypothetical protein [Psychromarinibacter sediminicola]
MLTKDTVFRPKARESKAAGTHSAAMLIIDAEIAARDVKTQRLRKARLERERSRPKPVAPAKLKKRTTPRKSA